MILGVYAYLKMDGNGKEAVKFYENALEAEVLGVQTYGELPDNPEFTLPDEAKDRVIHAQLRVGNTFLMLSDTFPGQPYETGAQVDVAITLNDVEKSKEVFGKLQDGGEVMMPLQETPWSSSYGQVKDKFGITWQISTIVE
ncbi:3-demethylubiquinone-9 3-methyltransferase [Alkalihalobacillus alcalophilus ATCC 27647 = CGMCC 1.3604]|uniref:3-demethylubiquinone-9 3-methyltransferase n=1 Tax=Alkalihalobacillus alcalophilus ATCC 27647 = CGMCC 1.3604 TaxID=1218173 RepID=A0A094WH83_ALKAL|nr:VOC family protein [Alkalihalobacillus alcalophilus]KGA97144.1 3-demethylubiquinone-9 3-methyltransferase [Alkalihalobacillus alcalophilus ATCC 27647 = CGMCC 1.3604]MED1563088.1 VOC family protein [Alkalihalobacillus alcalophilus]THG90568.1 3-demethylubiquinone-9 3-methyltransferase [Alkalihalobacillus alcalophilus ATCC 27647 = CGMCC 1.3604]